MLIIDGIRYSPWTPEDEEKEFHPLVKANSKEIFGKDSIYFDVKTMLKSASGIGSIPDAYVIKLSEPYTWYVIENELASHNVYDHVVKQLTKFINGIENKDARNQILDILYEQINKDGSLRATVTARIGNVEVYHFLSKLILAKKPRIVVIIDKITLELEEASNALSYAPDLVEFKTFVKEDDARTLAHLFEPLIKSGKTTEDKPRESAWQNWDIMLQEVDAPVRKATLELIAKLNGLGDVVYKGKTSCSAYIRQQRVKYGFAGLAPSKSELRIIIRPVPNLYDPKGWVSAKPSNWFTSRQEKQEREFRIKDEAQIDYAFALVKQSYEFVKKNRQPEN